MTAKDEARLLLTVREAGERLSLGRSLMYQLITSGEIDSVTIGRARRVPVAALDDYVRRLREAEGESRAS
ncbi:MAG: helix-turn-helix domain-containing protein [Actinomycetota bacterium]